MAFEFTIYAKGHENISANHKSTLEITKENHVTCTGDCIIGISADKSMLDFSESFKENLRNSDKITVEIEVDGLKEVITGKGNTKLTLDHKTDIVIRTSDFSCSRTLMVNSDKASKDINREIVEKLKKGADLKFKIIVE
ncbi:DUF371 domain-containing protein [Methanococcus maripaludis]|uniref:DUF371 domain-containing protein n=1 Tax=Methanococcus maripaludis TaxID=39152 RepID=A0A7J9P8M7_METMI|nr:DUF371 domain-containing protein [Methanococcus maripaludis]MBA2859542.1 hypothetical protein [Methanococcus maripaludis]